MNHTSSLDNEADYNDDFDFAAEPGAQSCENLTVPNELAGLRLDAALAKLLPDYSRSRLSGWIKDGAVLLNGNTAQPKDKLVGGETVHVRIAPSNENQAYTPEAMNLDVVYEDDSVLVVNKPAGLVVHPAAGNWRGTLLNGLLHHCPALAQVPRAGIVHRLDKDTSGLMVVARTRTACDALVRQIAARSVQREYWALAHGHWKHPVQHTLSVEQAIGRDPRNRLRMAVVDLQRQAGKEAKTDFTLLGNSTAPGTPACWVHCKLHTGRTHQIRVHMQHLGHPLLADAVYGGAPAWGMQRQALHAFRLSLQHPVTGQQLQCEAALPPDLQDAISAMGLASLGNNPN